MNWRAIFLLSLFVTHIHISVTSEKGGDDCGVCGADLNNARADQNIDDRGVDKALIRFLESGKDEDDVRYHKCSHEAE
ncbi:MAG: hypothetical protein AAF580_12900 [Pseudomonadota bacterium]